MPCRSFSDMPRSTPPGCNTAKNTAAHGVHGDLVLQQSGTRPARRPLPICKLRPWPIPACSSRGGSMELQLIRRHRRRTLPGHLPCTASRRKPDMCIWRPRTHLPERCTAPALPADMHRQPGRFSLETEQPERQSRRTMIWTIIQCQGCISVLLLPPLRL